MVKGPDGIPHFVGRSFFTSDKRACFAALEALKKMSPEAQIIQAFTREGFDPPP